VRVREDREGEDEVERDAAVGPGQVARAFGAELRAVAVVVDEVRAREGATAQLQHFAVEIEAPVVFVLDAFARAREEAADVAAEVQYLTALPVRPPEQLVEVGELRFPCRDYRAHSVTICKNDEVDSRNIAARMSLRERRAARTPDDDERRRAQGSIVQGTGSCKTP